LLGLLLEYRVFLPFEHRPGTNGRLLVTAKISAGSAIEIFVNNIYDKSYRVKIDPGKLSQYQFDKLPADISSIRIDPTDVAGAEVEIERLDFSVGGASQKAIDFNELSAWNRNELAQVAPGGTAFRTSGNDPWFIGSTHAFHEQGKAPESWNEWATAHSSYLLIAFLSILLLIGASGFRFGLPLCFSVLMIHFEAAPFILRLLERHRFGPSSIRHSIGNAVYIGYNKASENLGFALSLISAILLGAFFALLLPDVQAEGKERRKAFPWGAFLLFLLLFIVFNFPPLASVDKKISAMSVEIAGFDWGNVFTWDFLAQYGFLPFRDFWFPYGGDSLQLGNFPSSQLAAFFVRSIIFGALLYALLELRDQRWLSTLLALSVLGLLIESGTFQGTKRYLVSVCILLVGAALVKRQPRGIFPYVGFGLMLGWGFAREPNQLVYASPGLLLLAFFHVEQMVRKKFQREMFLQSLVLFGTAGIAIGAQILLLIFRGQWEGFLQFYTRMSAMAVSVSVPSPIERWYEFTPRFENVLMLGIHVIGAAGALSFFGKRRREQKVLGLTLLGLSSLLAMIFFKLLLRPHMAQQMLAILFIGLVLVVSILSEYWKRWQQATAALLAGLLAAQTFSPNFVQDVLSQHEALARDFAKNTSSALEGVTTSREKLDEFFRQSRFVKLDEDQRSVVEYLKTFNFQRFSQQLYVLGDDSYFYVLFKQKPCPYLSYYDGSNIGAQQDQITCLENSRPEVVVWDSSVAAFDAVPNIIRTPLLFDYIVANFTPLNHFGRFELFRRRDVRDAFDWKFWLRTLGGAVDMGAIPWISNFASLPDCSAREHCLEFVRIDSVLTGLDIRVGENLFHLSWKSAPAGSVGYINLSRLWFWSAARREGIEPLLPTGLQIQKKRSETDFLY